MSYFHDLKQYFDDLRKRQNLKPPGSFENLHRETRGIFPALHMIDGAKFDLNSQHNQNFQTMHSFGWGSAQTPANYHFGAVFANTKYIMHGQIDNTGTLQARGHYNWIEVPVPKHPEEEQPIPQDQEHHSTSTSKLQAQISQKPGASMFNLEHEFQGPDYNICLKSQNLNPIDRPGKNSKSGVSTTGNISVSYLQSITESMACGLEWTMARPSPNMTETATSFALKYAPNPEVLPPPLSLPPGAQSPYMPINPQDPTQVFTASFMPSSSMFQLSYWRRINQRLEVGTELQALVSPSTKNEYGRREGVSTVGFKLDTVFATIRAGIESSGKLMMVLEEKVTPNMSFQINGEIDYAKNATGKVGFGFTFEQ